MQLYLMPMATRVSLCIAIFLVPLLISTTIFAMQTESPNQYNDHEDEGASKSGFWGEKENMVEKAATMRDELNREKMGSRIGRKLEIAGSRIPDCSYACGSCSPCRLVMVSLTCADAAETCPISYRCMCNSKSYPVP